MSDTVTENRKKIHKNSTLGEESGKPPSGPQSAVENQPEPEGVRGTSGMSGKQDTDGPPAWCVMESDVLDGEKFLLVRDDLFSDEELQQRVTEDVRDQAPVTYRMTEMNHITEANLSDQDKRDLHELKKRFGGRVLGDDPKGERVPCVDIADWIDSVGG